MKGHPTRKLKALAAIAALSLGTLALAGCGNDDDLPPMEEPAMEQPEPMEPAQEPMPTYDDDGFDDDGFDDGDFDDEGF